jgi:hypothetical protein
MKRKRADLTYIPVADQRGWQQREGVWCVVCRQYNPPQFYEIVSCYTSMTAFPERKFRVSDGPSEAHRLCGLLNAADPYTLPDWHVLWRRLYGEPLSPEESAQIISSVHKQVTAHQQPLPVVSVAPCSDLEESA